MAVIPIRSGVQHGGIIWDAPPNELPANLWSNGTNCRLLKNTIERVGGPQRLETYTNGRALWGTKVFGVPGLLRISATTMELPRRLPERCAVPASSTRRFAATSPSTEPATKISVARIAPFQWLPSAIVTGPSISHSPSTSPQKI